jgi:hypothetical protein
LLPERNRETGIEFRVWRFSIQDTLGIEYVDDIHNVDTHKYIHIHMHITIIICKRYA